MIDYINVVLMNMPSSVNECVTPNEDGGYTIIINNNLNFESQRKAYNHALFHIENNDFEKNNTDEIEFVAHYGDKL